MRRKARYLYIELKKTAGMFPRMLLLAVALMILVGGIAFCGVKAMEREPPPEAPTFCPWCGKGVA